MVNAHRGGVRVESELGKGTCFTVVFPTSEQPRADKPEPPSEGRLRAGATVLVVDDEYEVRDVVKDMLTARGMRVLTAEDGPRAVEIFKQHANTIDVVLLDLAMPGMNGEEVLREIQAIRPDTKVIVSSGFTNNGIIEFTGTPAIR